MITIIVSGGEFKTDTIRWLGKAVRIARGLNLNRLDGCSCAGGLSACTPPTCNPTSSFESVHSVSIEDIEAKEEARRAFWLLFALDRHLSLSYNQNVSLSDDQCLIFSPLPETVWANIDTLQVREIPARTYGPPTIVSGTAFLEYFLPLMVILGDVIHIHHKQHHPRFGRLDIEQDIDMIEELLAHCSRSIERLSTTSKTFPTSFTTEYNAEARPPANPMFNSNIISSLEYDRARQVTLVKLYSRFVIHVIHVLLHGKWDPMSVLSDRRMDAARDHPSDLPSWHPRYYKVSDWITSPSFAKCASNAISASTIISEILQEDAELAFMPYLFGIYLLHGSFIVLLFADRMPEIGHGRNEPVGKACETIIRAHETCIVTLTTEFQKRFRKLLRATLYRVRIRNEQRLNASNGEQILTSAELSSRRLNVDSARDDLLSVYRWINGSQGLAV